MLLCAHAPSQNEAGREMGEEKGKRRREGKRRSDRGTVVKRSQQMQGGKIRPGHFREVRPGCGVQRRAGGA